MEWRDHGLVLGLKRHGEAAVIVEAMTREHGRALGLVRGGRSLRIAATLQPGNTLGLVWRARLEEHLGAFNVEALTLRAARLIGSAQALAGLSYLGALVRLLPERDPYDGLYAALELIADRLDDPALAPALIARFEARLLTVTGFALDLSQCALTGAKNDLVYVSPRSGRAVSAGAGAPWRDKLLALPAFLVQEGGPSPTREDVDAAFRLTGFFLRRDLFAPRGLDLPDARRAFLAAVGRMG